MFKQILCLTGILSCMCIPTRAQQLRLNEVCQSNIHMVFDAKEFPDSWIEIHNPTDRPVNLQGWRVGLTDSFEQADKITADTLVTAGGYLLIYCDKSDEGDPAPLHTSFRIDSGKGSVYLFTPGGEIADEVSLKKMPAPEISYGRLSSNPSKWGYQIIPSPGSENSGESTAELLPSPVFSVSGGVYTQPFELTISAPEGTTLPADAILCVTTDGREPVETDRVHGLSFTFTIEKSTSVRAKFVSAGRLNPLSVTNSYIFDRTRMPIISITTDPAYLYSDSIGIFHGVRGEDPNYAYDWRRPINIELFFPGENGRVTLFNQLGETRVKGNSTRHLPQKSIVVYANKRFGTKRFDCTGVWPEKPHVTIAKSFELKSSGADFDRAHMRDPLVNLLIGRNNPNVDWQAFNAAITYINGEFKGIYELRERTNEDFIEANFDGLEDIDMIENWNEVKAGSIDGLMEFYDLLNSKEVSFDQIAEMLDLDNTLPVLATNIFGSNYDSGGGNNTVMWRTHEENAKWRHVVKDVDLWGGTWDNTNIDYDMFSSFISWDSYAQSVNKFRYWIHSVYFLTDSIASSHLINHIVAATGDYLQPEYFNSVADEIHDYYVEDYGRYLNLYFNWSENSLVRIWEEKIQQLKDFVVARRPVLFSQITHRYHLGPHFNLTIDHSSESIAINGVDLYRPKFDGLYFAERPLTLSSKEDKILLWEIIKEDTLGVVSNDRFIGSEITITTPSSTDSVSISVTSIPGEITEIMADTETTVKVCIDGTVVTVESPSDIVLCEVYDISGRKVLSTGKSVFDLDRTGLFIIRITDGQGVKRSVKVAVR